MSEELKPCPFCGSTNIQVFAIRKAVNFEPVREYTIMCGNCQASTATIIYERQKAIEAWNRRA